MRRPAALLLAFVMVIALLPCLTGCGATVGFKSDLSAVSGTVSSVHVTISDDGSSVTFVTLQSNGFANQLAFCGNNANQFPMNTSVTVKFNPGQNCNQIVVVIAG